MLDGLKTYIVAAVAILSALLAYLSGEIPLAQTVEAIGIALGIGGNRYVAAVGEIMAYPRTPADVRADPNIRILVTWLGTGLTVLTAMLAGLKGVQAPVLTIGAILGALGQLFLGLGVRKSVAPT